MAGGAAMGSGGASIVAACAARKVAGEAGGAASVALHVVREPAKLGPKGRRAPPGRAAGLRRGCGGAPAAAQWAASWEMDYCESAD